MGRLTKKIDGQFSQLVSAPPISGPIANEAPMRAGAVANMIAAPMPCTARATSRARTLPASPAGQR